MNVNCSLLSLLISSQCIASWPIDIKRELIDGRVRLMINERYLRQELNTLDVDIKEQSQTLHKQMLENTSGETKAYITEHNINPFGRITKSICQIVLDKARSSGHINLRHSSDMVFEREVIDTFVNKWPIYLWFTTDDNVRTMHQTLFHRDGGLVVYRTESFIPFEAIGLNDKIKLSEEKFENTLAEQIQIDSLEWEHDSNSLENLLKVTYVEVEGEATYEIPMFNSRAIDLADDFFGNNYIYPVHASSLRSALYWYREMHDTELVDIDHSGSVDLLVIEAFASNTERVVYFIATMIDVHGAEDYDSGNWQACINQNRVFE